MQMLLLSVFLGYLAIWVVLLVHLLRRKEFYPIFGKGWGTKVFWLVTFVLFNPLLTVLYFLFGVLAKPSQPSLARAAIALVPAILVLAITEMPTLGSARPLIMRRGPDGKMAVVEGKRLGGINGRLTVFFSSANSNSTTVKSTPSNGRFACRRVVLVNRSSHPLIERVALDLQERLAKFPLIERIAYYPHGAEPPTGEPANDVMIFLDAPRILSVPLPFIRWSRAVVSASAGTEPITPATTYHEGRELPAIAFNWTSTLQHKGVLLGFESARARHGQAAAAIAQEFAESLAKLFSEYQQKDGLMPTLPASFNGTFREPPKFAFLKDSAQVVALDYGLMRHCRAIWLLEDDRDTTSAMRAIKAALEPDGWEARSNDATELRMKKGAMRLTAFRRQARFDFFEAVSGSQEKPKPQPIVVRYEEPFTDAEIEKALGDLLQQDAPVETLMMFKESFERGPLKERFEERLANRPARSAEAQVALAEMYQSRQDEEKAREAILRARALLVARREDDDLRRRLVNLARKIGDERLTEMDISEEVYRGAGFLEATSRSLERVVALDEPLLLFRKKSDGTIEAFCYRVYGAAEENDPSPYRLEFTLARENGRQWSSIGGRVDKDHWVSAGSPLMTDCPYSAKAEALGNQRFRLSVNRITSE